jgi:hypothetical protein
MLLAKSIAAAFPLLGRCRRGLAAAALVLLTHVGAANAFSWDAAKEERALQRIRQVVDVGSDLRSSLTGSSGLPRIRSRGARRR